jgi:hypothetical protein
MGIPQMVIVFFYRDARVHRGCGLPDSWSRHMLVLKSVGLRSRIGLILAIDWLLDCFRRR